MPKLKNHIPKLCRHHKGQAFLKVGGQQVWLGRYGDPLTQEKYDRFIAQWLANGRTAPSTSDGAVVLCMRTAEGAEKEIPVGTDRGYLHRLETAPQRPMPSPRKKIGSGFDTLEAAIDWTAKREKSTPTGRWSYQDTNGDELFIVVRFDGETDGKTSKSFRPFRKSDGKWQISAPPGPLPLYRVKDLKDASRIYVVEGEKACDAACKLGQKATTSAHGSKSPEKSDWAPIGGREVVILPDNDEVGRKYGQKVTKLLLDIDPSTQIKQVELPDLPHKGDIVDYIEARSDKTPEQLRAEVEGLVDRASQARVDKEPSSGLVWRMASEIDPEDVAWLWEDVLVGGAINLILGYPDQGKGCLSSAPDAGLNWRLRPLRPPKPVLQHDRGMPESRSGSRGSGGPGGGRDCASSRRWVLSAKIVGSSSDASTPKACWQNQSLHQDTCHRISAMVDSIPFAGRQGAGRRARSHWAQG